jgi:hypothetical protein
MANVRERPDGRVVGFKYKGDRFLVFEIKDNWARIDPDGKRWILATYMIPVKGSVGERSS